MDQTHRGRGGQRLLYLLRRVSAPWEGYCHDPFPLLSPTSTILHKPHQSHLTNPSQNFPNLIGPLDQSRSHLTGHLGPFVVASQATTRTPFGKDFASLRDGM